MLTTPDENPVGQQVVGFGEKPYQIIGIVDDAKHSSSRMLLVATAASLIPAMRAARVNPSQPSAPNSTRCERRT
jgi:hypothetical protein